MRFDNIFYESKDDFLRVLNYFIDTKNEKLYKKRGVCKKLCILMHGKPGVGKSATIKSIVNHFADIGLKKHIVQVQLNRVKTCSELNDIFFKSNTGDYDIDPGDKVIILEDIDCMSDIVTKRDNNEIKKITLNNVKQMIMSANNDIDNEMISSLGKISKDTCNKNENDKITLSYILNLLDGINEISNRVVILTTNHPEKLDPALIRPGRIDYVLELKYSRIVDIQHILENYFETNIDLKDFENIKDFTYSPAFIKQLCNKYSMLQASDAVSNIIEELL
jgi:chaperone BCS1